MRWETASAPKGKGTAEWVEEGNIRRFHGLRRLLSGRRGIGQGCGFIGRRLTVRDSLSCLAEVLHALGDGVGPKGK
jgi:hypothetical protein